MYVCMYVYIYIYIITLFITMINDVVLEEKFSISNKTYSQIL